MLGNLFKPKWQHQDSAVRLKAVQQLDVTDPDQKSVLADLAQHDPDRQVQLASLGRLDDTALLIQLYQKAAAPQTAHIAARLMSLISDAATIGSIDDKTLLTELAAHCSNTELLFTILEQLDDQSAFADIAIYGSQPPLRAEAAHRVTLPAQLKRLQREGRDKKVQQYARQQLKSQQKHEQEKQQQHQHIDELVKRLEQLANKPIDPLYKAKLTHLQEEWEQQASNADALQTAAANQHLQAAQQQIDDVRNAEAAKKEAAAAADRQAACLQNFSAFFSQLTADCWDDTAPQELRYSQLVDDWFDATKVHPAIVNNIEQFNGFQRRWSDLRDDNATLHQLVGKPSTTINDTDKTDDANQISDSDKLTIKHILSRWPANIAAPTFITELGLHIHDKSTTPKKPATKKPQRARHAGLLHQLRSALKARQLKNANRVWQRLTHAMEKHPDAASEHQANDLKTTLDELRDWHAFAAEPKKQALCERMETLQATPLTHPEEQANAIRALHEEWHELMSSDQDADQSLWDRFRQASDNAYDHCREHFKELDAKQADMLQQRIALCDQLDTFLAAQNWENANGAAIWEIRRQAPNDWKQLSPVRYTDARDVGIRFHKQLKTLDRHLKTIGQANQPQLDALLQQFQALNELENTHDAATQAKQLQQQWRNAGWVHPRQYKPLNKQKQQLCDAIFGQIKAERDADKAKQQVLSDALQHDLEQLKSLLDGKQPAELSTLDNAIAQVKDTPAPPRSSLQRKKQQLLRDANQLKERKQQESYWRSWQALFEKAPAIDTTDALRELCVALEVTAGCDSPASAKNERLAWQVGTMANAMKSRKAPDIGCRQLLETHQALIESGLDAESRQRLNQVINALSDTLSASIS